MKTSIWVNNLKGDHFEIYNTAECFLNTGKEFSYTERCKEFDLINYNPRLVEKTFQVIHEGNSKEETEFIIKYLRNKLYEKSQLLQQIKALKRIKDNSISHIIENIKKTEYAPKNSELLE